ncbi:hypothetical protein DSO57_1003487 [Entomophthora muscae]|uniref:Uncharacterized protein n=1 Tax=Entomophthora muscae TaxID=34485 RepID=A0ACC2RN92_9FUNG|nr:hypothetical protein DSO57_1003487 [Entomophthora muscae]
MPSSSRVHTPLYASQPTGRRSLSNQQRVVESVLPDALVAQIRTLEFDDMLHNGFHGFSFFGKSKPVVSTLKLTLTPSNARDSCSKRLSRFWF